MEAARELELFIHDEKRTIRASDVTPETTLNDYLRTNMGLTGVKVMCKEGGCGSCVVTVTGKHPVTQKEMNFAVNSCLVSIFSCSGWKISTIEGLGTPKNMHPIQQQLVKYNGTQCGFCTSGMIMNMYALYLQGNVTRQEIENSFGGNICRCTGYRSILAAFKSLSLEKEEGFFMPDIEEAEEACKREKCEQSCPIPCSKKSLLYNVGGARWYKVNTIKEILDILKSLQSKMSYKLVAGNTARGVYHDLAYSDIYIDVSNVAELQKHSLNTNDLVLGGNTTLTETMEIFANTSQNDPNFKYLEKCREHLDLVAHVPVRNIGTIAGNLMIKHTYNEFPSDVFLLLETVGAMLKIVDVNGHETRLKPSHFLQFDMTKKVIKSVSLPPLDKTYKFESYKIMIRAQNTHAMVNAGFLLKMNTSNVIQMAKIVYGGINPQFVHAEKAEDFLLHKNVFDNGVMLQLFTILDDELKPNWSLPDPSPEFRKQLAISLFYKFILSVAPKVSAVNVSGGKKLVRGPSSGTQDYTTNKEVYPLTQPLVKLEAVAQCTGTAKYIMDAPDLPGQLYAAFVLTKAPANTKIVSVDTKAALSYPGVVSYVDRHDIPGINSFTAPSTNYPENETIFVEETIQHYSQPVGLIVAVSQLIAEKGAELVTIKYLPSKIPPILNVQDILKSGEPSRLKHERSILPKREGKDIKHTIKGQVNISWQYHYHMETQCCTVVPVENGCFNVYPSTQWLDHAQASGASCLGIPLNKINVSVERCGGAYGAKISRNSWISCAALVASNKLSRPIKLWMPFTDNMNMVGKRNPTYATYEHAVDENGLTQYLKLQTYTDNGIHSNEAIYPMLENLVTNYYNDDTFELDVYTATTDTSASTWTRAPGSVEGLAIIETIMEHTAYVINKDPLAQRMINLKTKEHPKLKQFIDELVQRADIDKRKDDIKNFNKLNRWMKRGLSVVPMAYTLGFEGNFNVIVTIYQGDGSVAIAHGGIEIGQGINTKATQVVAFALKIPLNMVSVKPTNSLSCPNCSTTGGSITSEAVCAGLLAACNELLKRIEPIRNKDENKGKNWADLIKACYNAQIDLCATHMWKASDSPNYNIYGVAAAEVLLDCLTGNHLVTRVDLVEDTGDSMSPLIDIGQVEGAYIMGMGYWTTEEIIITKEGELKTNRTWTYKPPGIKDIPIEFKVRFPSKNANENSPFKTKATAEPPQCLAFGLPLAMRQAVKSARMDSSPTADGWVPINGPSTVEHTFMSCLNNYKQYTL